jgi:hypothetical protein
VCYEFDIDRKVITSWIFLLPQVYADYVLQMTLDCVRGGRVYLKSTAEMDYSDYTHIAYVFGVCGEEIPQRQRYFLGSDLSRPLAPFA